MDMVVGFISWFFSCAWTWTFKNISRHFLIGFYRFMVAMSKISGNIYLYPFSRYPGFSNYYKRAILGKYSLSYYYISPANKCCIALYSLSFFLNSSTCLKNFSTKKRKYTTQPEKNLYLFISHWTSSLWIWVEYVSCPFFSWESCMDIPTSACFRNRNFLMSRNCDNCYLIPSETSLYIFSTNSNVFNHSIKRSSFSFELISSYSSFLIFLL